MKIENVIELLNKLAPLHYAEEFDNVGLLVGNKQTMLTGILVTLDTLEAVVDEAIAKNCNLIVSFHPIIFNGLKRLNGGSYVERTVEKAIKNNIAIYAIHTALDNSFQGVNNIICDRLNLINRKILIPKTETIKKLVTYVPFKHADSLKRELFKAGAGSLGNYDDCSFSVKGTGSYKGNDSSNPIVGNKNEYHEGEEVMISITFNAHLEIVLMQALRRAHPYEEIAFEITTLENTNQHIGMGMVGEFATPIPFEEFIASVKQTMKVPFVRHSETHINTIKTVAVLGGSGSFAIKAAKKAKADIFITADLKYHDFFLAENQIILADIGHYESEQFTKTFLTDYLSEKITNFAVVLSTTNTNPVKYL